MKFQRSTLILVGVAFLLGAGVLIAESQRSQPGSPTAQTDTAGPIFTFAESDVATLTIDRGNETLVFELDADGNWQMLEPETALAEPGAVAFLLSRLITDSALQTVTMTADQAADFGFNAPVGIVTVGLNDGTEHELILGGPDFSGSADYAVIDPDPWPPEAGIEYSVLVVTRDVANGINRPFEEWLMPVETPDTEAGEDGAATPGEGETLDSPVDLEEAPPGSAEPAAPETDATPTN
ncbi:MAG: hypothetical protein EA368_07375 [Leptolyngbya sp. DLM2.Bin27]|nr:MAG: hypothetical protein EA368_07375 [Leptolyngbya sp. DLM2.Bin27]